MPPVAHTGFSCVSWSSASPGVIAAIHAGCLSGIKYPPASPKLLSVGCQVDKSLWDLLRLGIPGCIIVWSTGLVSFAASGLRRLEETELAHSEQSDFGAFVFAMGAVSSTCLQSIWDVFRDSSWVLLDRVGSCWIF